MVDVLMQYFVLGKFSIRIVKQSSVLNTTNVQIMVHNKDNLSPINPVNGNTLCLLYSLYIQLSTNQTYTHTHTHTLILMNWYLFHCACKQTYSHPYMYSSYYTIITYSIEWHNTAIAALNNNTYRGWHLDYTYTPVHLTSPCGRGVTIPLDLNA